MKLTKQSEKTQCCIYIDFLLLQNAKINAIKEQFHSFSLYIEFLIRQDLKLDKKQTTEEVRKQISNLETEFNIQKGILEKHLEDIKNKEEEEEDADFEERLKARREEVAADRKKKKLLRLI